MVRQIDVQAVRRRTLIKGTSLLRKVHRPRHPRRVPRLQAQVARVVFNEAQHLTSFSMGCNCEGLTPIGPSYQAGNLMGWRIGPSPTL
jgi:hypothetical protein